MTENQPITLDNFLSLHKDINSPRSLDALFRLGIDEKDLYPTSEEEILKTEPDPDIAREIYDHYEHNRKKKLRIAQNERNDCIRLMEMMQQDGMTFDLIMKNYRSHDGSFIAPSLLREKIKRLEKFLKPIDDKGTKRQSLIPNQGNTLIKAEQHRLEMLRRRQEREIQTLLMLERRRADIDKEIEEKRKAEEAKNKELEKQKEIKRRELIEKKKQAELAKKEKEEKEMKETRQKYLADYKKHQEQIAQEELIEKQLQKERRMKEEEDARKQEQIYMENMMKRKKQDDAIMEKKMKLEQEEQERLRKLEEEREKSFEVQKKRREQMKDRIRMSQMRNEKLEEDRKIAYQEKQKRLNDKLIEEKRREEEIQRLKLIETLEKEKKYKETYDHARHLEESRSLSIIEKERLKEEQLRKNKERMDKQNAIKRTRNYLTQLEKLDNVDRNHKALRVYKSLLEEKIEKDDERTREIMSAKQQLLLERQRQQGAIMRQRHEIHSAMEKLRVTNSFNSFNKTIEKLGMASNSPRRSVTLPYIKKEN